jgi:hypothetical protein
MFNNTDQIQQTKYINLKLIKTEFLKDLDYIINSDI